jgi:hypothetical protein
LRNSTELGEQAMTRRGLEQPFEQSSLVGVRLAIELYRYESEPSVNQILGSSPRSHAPRIGEVSGLSERRVREDAWAATWPLGGGF